MDENFQRIIRLIKKTGDKMIFFDSQQPENSFVMFPLEVYEREVDRNNQVSRTPALPLDLTEGGLADKINSDLVAWKNEINPEFLAEEVQIGGQYFVQGPQKTTEKIKNWQIPEPIKHAAEEVVE